MASTSASPLRLQVFGVPALTDTAGPVRLALKRGYALLAYLALVPPLLAKTVMRGLFLKMGAGMFLAGYILLALSNISNPIGTTVVKELNDERHIAQALVAGTDFAAIDPVGRPILPFDAPRDLERLTVIELGRRGAVRVVKE